MGMGEIVKRRQLIELKRYGAVQDLGFNEMRLILKFSFKHPLMNGMEKIKPGANVIKLFCPWFTDFCAKLEYHFIKTKSLPMTNALAYYENP